VGDRRRSLLARQAGHRGQRRERLLRGLFAALHQRCLHRLSRPGRAPGPEDKRTSRAEAQAEASGAQNTAELPRPPWPSPRETPGNFHLFKASQLDLCIFFRIAAGMASLSLESSRSQAATTPSVHGSTSVSSVPGGQSLQSPSSVQSNDGVHRGIHLYFHALLHADPSRGRGFNRGRWERVASILRTRPDRIESKRGSGGNQVRLATNYFALKCHKDWRLYHYRVDFAPDDEDRLWMRRKLLEQHKARLGNYIFDGASIFTPERYAAPGASITLNSRREDDSKLFKLTVRLVAEVHSTEGPYIQFFNILLNRCMEVRRILFLRFPLDLFALFTGLEFDQAGQELLRCHGAFSIPRFYFTISSHFDRLGRAKLDRMAPEVVAGLRDQHPPARAVLATLLRNLSQNPEDGHVGRVLLAFSHNFSSRVYDQLMMLRRQAPSNLQNVAKRALIGAIIITQYNKRQYRIDDIDFNNSVEEYKFDWKNRPGVTLSQYYKERYNLTIKDKVRRLSLLLHLPYLSYSHCRSSRC